MKSHEKSVKHINAIKAKEKTCHLLGMLQGPKIKEVPTVNSSTFSFAHSEMPAPAVSSNSNLQ